MLCLSLFFVSVCILYSTYDVSKDYHVLSTDALCGFCWCRGVFDTVWWLPWHVCCLLILLLVRHRCVVFVFRFVSCRAFVGAYVVYCTLGDRTGIFVLSFAFSSFRFGVIVAWVPIHRSIDRSIDRPSSLIVSIVHVTQYPPPGWRCNRSPDWWPCCYCWCCYYGPNDSRSW